MEVEEDGEHEDYTPLTVILFLVESRALNENFLHLHPSSLRERLLDLYYNRSSRPSSGSNVRRLDASSGSKCKECGNWSLVRC